MTLAFPRMVLGALEELGSDDLGDLLAVDAECEGARFHSPTPLLVRRVALGREGTSPPQPPPTAMLCGTCADNLAVIRHLLVKSGGDLSWPVRREFGNTIRALAVKGYEHDRSTWR